MIITITPVKNRIPQKYYAWIWVGLVVASLFRASFSLVSGYYDIAREGAAKVVLNVVLDAFMYGLIPAWLCFCCASIFFNLTFRRGVYSVPRNDFIYLTMLFTMGARILMGFVEIFALLDATVYVYTSVLLDVTVLTGALYAMYLAVLVPRYMTAKDAYNGFAIHSTAYLICQAVHTGIPCLSYFFMTNESFKATYGELFDAYGVSLAVDEGTVTACWIALGVFLGYVIAAIVIAAVLKKRADKEAPSDGDGNGIIEDGEDPFGQGEDKVFEEFDI